VADFYAARDRTVPPLPGPNIAPPFTAVLHERVVKKETWTLRYGAVVTLETDRCVIGHASSDDSPARAWLLAILKALIAQGKEQ
jgi:hypothetical protein